MRYLSYFLLLSPLLPWGNPCARAAEEFKLAEGDKVVWVGNTLIEREQQTGYWETALTCRFADRNVTFRNLGWSGDSVFGEARAGFGSAADGLRRLHEHVQALKPTVIFVGYGLNESFEGEAGLPRFREGLDKLLDALSKTKARVVILSPLRQEDVGRPLPDPTEQNRKIRLYRDVLRQAAEKRGHAFVDLYELMRELVAVTGGEKMWPLTENGIHLTPRGYWWSAPMLERGLGLPPARWLMDIDKDGKWKAEGAKLEKLEMAPLRFQVKCDVLPAPTFSPHSVRSRSSPTISFVSQRLRIAGLAPGKYVLRIDGKEVAANVEARWAEGEHILSGPEFDQVERLRQAIIDKNRLYFQRWRPENETYLFGFRSNEQGKNAKEIPEFDPLIAKLEAEIAKLRVPVAHSYELLPQQERDK